MNETRMFADEIASGIMKYFPEDRQIQCRVVETMKNNNVARVGITFHEQGDKVGPVIYMEPYREAATDGRPMSEIMREIAGIASRSMDKTERIGSLDYGDYESVKEYLSVTLINGRDNRQMLSRMPHRQMEDLALILELKFPMEEGVGSIKVSHELAELWAVDTDTLFAQAQENSLKAEPPSLHRMEDTMLSLAFGRDAAENLLENPAPEEVPSQLYVLSNMSKNKGAAVLSYPGVLEKADQLFPQGFYILPSSIHEMLIVPKSPEINPKELGEMVRAVNRAEVAKEEQLSDRVYEYDREAGTIRQVQESIRQKEVREAVR